jgi:hypothetical protein
LLPAPGNTPIKKPWTDCRPITGAIDFASSFVIRKFSILLLSLCEALAGFKTKKIASGNAKIAIASVIKLKP